MARGLPSTLPSRGRPEAVPRLDDDLRGEENMKSFTLFAVLVALAGGTALALQEMGHLSVAGAGYTTGVVELIDSNSMTLREDSNRIVTILIVPGTVGAENHLIGSRVKVTFHHNDSNQAIADEIQGVTGEAEAKTVATTSAPAVQAMPAAAPAPTVTKEKTYVPAPAAIEQPTTASTPTIEPKLPHTASPLAAIGLLGLMSLGGALVLRFTH
jgi:hypothetical protein